MKTGRAGSVLLLTAILTGVWYLLSGRFDLLHFGTGVAAAFLISLTVLPNADSTSFRLGRFLLYVPWLIGQIVISNLRVARLVLSRNAAIAPAFIAQRPDVVGPRALTMLGCSITLTPGTLTIDVGEEEIFVHALDVASADDVRENVMSRRVLKVFSPDPVR
ncbi:Na+/H+ antiporter subunit E [soil metagenome]